MASGEADQVSSLLAEVVRATGRSPTGDALLDRTAQLLTRRADWVIADRLEDPDLIVRVAAYGPDGRLPLPTGMGPAPARRSSAGSIGLLPRVLRAPQRMLHLDRDALQAAAGEGETHQARQAGMALSLGTTEMLIVGLTSHDQVLGVLSLGRRGTPFSQSDLADLADIAIHLGLALESARLLSVQSAVATAMQTNLLPPLPAVPGLRLAARYVPAAHGLDVGGDWYDAFDTSAGLTVVVGDTTGHDVLAAARMAELRNLLRAHAADGQESPSQIISRLDRTAAILGVDALASCLVGRLAPSGEGRWQLWWASAGHLPPVLVHAGQAQLMETAADLMLGVDPAAERVDHSVELVPGDLLVLYTDGLIEVRGTPLTERLELLRETVEKHADNNPDLLAEALLDAFITNPTDDVALFVVAVPD